MSMQISAKARCLMARSVHVKMHPTARTFNERREVLRVLERFGEITMFRSFKYHPTAPVYNAFIAMFTTETSATELIRSSPIRYHLRGPSSDSADTTTPSTSEATELLETIGASPLGIGEATYRSVVDTKHQENSQLKAFELHISTPYFDHIRHVQEQPLHGPYKPVDHKQSYIASSLREVIPESLWADGLMDWDTEGMKWRKDMVHEQVAGWTEKDDVSAAWRIAVRTRERIANDLPPIMKDLAGVAKKYQQEQQANAVKASDQGRNEGQR